MVNASTQKWVDKLKPKAPTAPTIQSTPTPVVYAQQTDPNKAKISSIGEQISGPGMTTTTTTPTPTPTNTNTSTSTTKTTTPTPVKGVLPTNTGNNVDESQAMFGAGLPTAPKPTTETTQPTDTTTTATGETTTQGTTTQAPTEERIGESKTDEQKALQDNIDKTQEELNNLKNREDALSQAEYLKKTKELQEYQAKQKEITDKQKAMTEEQALIQSSRKIADAQEALQKLKRNTAYLNSSGLGQSAGALDAYSQQLSRADQVFNEMVKYEQYAQEMRKLGMEFDSNAYERSMKEQQDELDKYVSDTIQDMFNNYSAAQIAEQMDTVEEVDAFATKYFNSIDTNIANMTRKQIVLAEQKIAAQTKLLEDVRKFAENKNVVNKDMSTARGYYVDGNGSPLIDATTGGTIPTPVEAPMDPIFDKATGKLITFATGPNGEIVSNVQQIIEQPVFDQQSMQSFAKMFANGKIKWDDIPESVRNNVNFLNVANKTQPDVVKDWKEDINGKLYYVNDNGEKIYATEGGGVDPQGSNHGSKLSNSLMTVGGAENLAATMQYGVPYDCGDRSQCGMWYNDAIGGKNGTWVGNTYASKTQFIDPAIDAKGAQAGMGVVFNPGSTAAPYGHIGVLASGLKTVNGISGYDVISANYTTSNKLTKDFVPLATIAASGGGFIPTKLQAPQQQQQQQEQQTVPEGKSYSDIQKSLMLNMDAKNLTKNDMAILKQNGLTAEDLYGYKASRTANRWQTGMDDTEIKRINAMADDFYATPTAKKFNTVQEAFTFIQDLESGQAATDNQAMIYAFAKAMDPESVVREGEYSTVQKYSQTWGDQLGMNINRALNNQEFISEKAKKNMVNTIKTKYNAVGKQYETERKTYINRVNDYAGSDIGDRVIPSNYTGDVKQSQTNTIAPAKKQAADDLWNRL